MPMRLGRVGAGVLLLCVLAACESRRPPEPVSPPMTAATTVSTPSASTITSPSTPTAPLSECASDDDCGFLQKGDDCCTICARVASKEVVARIEKHCALKKPEACPEVVCSRRAFGKQCVAGKCAEKNAAP